MHMNGRKFYPSSKLNRKFRFSFVSTDFDEVKQKEKLELRNENIEKFMSRFSSLNIEIPSDERLMN